jgi:hypothetical protein
LICAAISGLVGQKLLKKHFEKFEYQRTQNMLRIF